MHNNFNIIPAPGWLFILLIIISTGCEKVISVKIPGQEPQLSIYSEVTADSLIHVQVSKSVGPLEPLPDTLSINNADLKLFEDGNPLENPVYDPATFSYVLKTKAVPGREYKMRGFVPGFSEVSAVTTVPEVIPVFDKKYLPGSRTVVLGGTSMTANELRISFRDPASGGDFYIIRIARDSGVVRNLVFVLDPGIDNQPENLDEPGKMPSYTGSGICLNDKLFNGDIKTISLVLISDVKDCYVELLHVNEAFYKFFLARDFANGIKGNPFAEPANTPGNVQNGLGVFGGVAKSRVKIGD